MFTGNPTNTYWGFQDIYFHQHSICFIQDTIHVFKKIRNNTESSKLKNRTGLGRYLLLNERCIVWEHWEECFKFNFQSGFAVHNKLSEDHINLTPSSKMRNELAIQVLNKDMLYLMRAYQRTLQNPENLASSIDLLEKKLTVS